MPTTKATPGSPLTAVENLVISLVYKAMGERRGNRTGAEYESIAAKLPPLKQLHFLVNEALRKFLAPKGDQHPEFCRFQAGDLRVVYEKYPDRISRETLRKALILHGFRVPRWECRLSH
jgi:hypothetical protein